MHPIQPDIGLTLAAADQNPGLEFMPYPGGHGSQTRSGSSGDIIAVAQLPGAADKNSQYSTIGASTKTLQIYGIRALANDLEQQAVVQLALTVCKLFVGVGSRPGTGSLDSILACKNILLLNN